MNEGFRISEMGAQVEMARFCLPSLLPSFLAALGLLHGIGLFLFCDRWLHEINNLDQDAQRVVEYEQRYALYFWEKKTRRRCRK